MNPYLNAVVAAAYIWGVQALIYFISPPPDTGDTVLTAVVAISLLVFSVALMGYLFFYQPVALMLDNKKKEAGAFFLKMLGTFGAILIASILAFSFFPDIPQFRGTAETPATNTSN